MAFQALSCSPSIQTLSTGIHCTPSGGRDLTSPLVRTFISWATAQSFHFTVACWEFQLGCLLHLHCSAVCPLLPQPSQPTSIRAAPGRDYRQWCAPCGAWGHVGSSLEVGFVGVGPAGGWADDVPSFGARVGPLTALLPPPLLYLAATGNLMSFPLSAGRAYSVGW